MCNNSACACACYQVIVRDKQNEIIVVIVITGVRSSVVLYCTRVRTSAHTTLAVFVRWVFERRVSDISFRRFPSRLALRRFVFRFRVFATVLPSSSNEQTAPSYRTTACCRPFHTRIPVVVRTRPCVWFNNNIARAACGAEIMSLAAAAQRPPLR